MTGALVECDSGRVLVARVTRAAGTLGRSIGLLGRSELGPGEGMWFDGAAAVHTLGMRFAIDVVFVAADGTVLRIAERVPPWRLWEGARGAKALLELAAGAARDCGIAAGMRVKMQWA